MTRQLDYLDTGRERVCFLSIQDVITRTSLSRSAIYRKMEAGVFPRSVNLGGRRVAFIEKEIDEWMGEKVSEREAVVRFPKWESRHLNPPKTQ